MSLIKADNITFAYEGGIDNVFENLSFEINTNWKLGLIGRNGRGKTTLLKLLRGALAYNGSIYSSVDFEYFPYTVENKAKTVAKAMTKFVPEYALWRLKRELNLLELPESILDRCFDTLSGGEQTKVLLAAMFINETNFPLIDEPTNHLDQTARKSVGKYLNGKSGFILVSHDRALLNQCIDHVFSINKSDIEIQKGNFSTWLKNREMQDEYEISKNEALKREINRLTDSAKRSKSRSNKCEKTKYDFKNSGLKPDKGYIGHKSAKMMKRSKSIEKRRQKSIKDKSELLKNIEESEALNLKPLMFHSKTLLELKDVSIFYNGKEACSPISFCIERGDRIALCGGNGSGKTSLIKLICGESINYTGMLTKKNNIKISYVKQDTSDLSGDLYEFSDMHKIDESLFKAILRKLGFSRGQFEKNISEFSDGQKKKVLIAKSLCESAHLYIWDEPLNYIDVISRMQIEKLLLDNNPTILFVEHDSIFCDKIATKNVMLQHKTTI